MEVARLDDEIRSAQAARPTIAFSEQERVELMALAEDLPRAWSHPNASVETRKRILREVLEEIIVDVEPAHLHLKLHWKGGEHTSLEVPKSRHGEHRWKTSVATEELIRNLARLLPDASIAGVLNRLGMRSAKGHTWTQLRVRNFRAERGIAIYREGERAERGELILHEAATYLSVSKMTIIRLIKDGIVPAEQTCPGAPYVIRKQDLDRPFTRRIVASGRAVPRDQRQEQLAYQ